MRSPAAFVAERHGQVRSSGREPTTPVCASDEIAAAAGLRLANMERTRGFEPRLLPWKGSVLQLHHVREASL